MICKFKHLHLCVKIGIIAAAIAIALIVLAFFIFPLSISVGLVALGAFLLVSSLLLICKNKLISAINTVGLILVGIAIALASFAMIFAAGDVSAIICTTFLSLIPGIGFIVPVILISVAALALFIPGIILTFKRCKKKDRICRKIKKPHDKCSD
ncbi:MAG: hypothetical protein GX824_08725 [Clostridiales bacterium]|jgi:peptidoglycan biosynthesis protein MviN/MurJ (putative lipid II flippase)|nr:hypothetical protein [Clostridiales bacterium]